MKAPRWLSLLFPAVLGAVALVLLVGLWLWSTDRFLVVQHDGGDQTQSSPVDLEPRPPSDPLPVLPETEVRNVILILGDGMGFSQVALARSELVGLNDKLFIQRFPFTGWQTTHGLESVYTDSASSASSLATGYKVPYYRDSMDVDGRPLRTVAEAARDRGLAVGLVTDSYLWDATMAAFLTHVESRRQVEDIAGQMAESGVAFLAGENHEDIPEEGDDETPGTRELLDQFRREGFEVVRSVAELERLPASPDSSVLALFAPSEIADPERPPRLVELTALAQRRLVTNPGGYLLVVESEEPDSGGHRRDLQRIVGGIKSVNEVAELAVEQALVDGSTLVLVTADHETGGIAILHGDAEHTLGVRWSTTSHSAEPVPIYAFGPGAARFSGVKDNTDVARVLSDLLGLEMFENP